MFRRALLTTTLCAFFLSGSFGLSSCQWIKTTLGITDTVDAPKPETPEWVVWKAIQAAILSYKENEPAGWAEFKKLLHSSEVWSNATTRTWREMRWSTMRRKVYLFTKDKDTPQAGVKNSSPTYEIAREGEGNNGQIKKIFVVNEKSDNPTPCWLKKDPKAGDHWRIVTTCLN